MNNITLALQEIGVPAHVAAIAKTHGTTPSKVERGIRHAIEICWDRCDISALASVFGPIVGAREKRPANAEFIAALAEQLRMEGQA